MKVKKGFVIIFFATAIVLAFSGQSFAAGNYIKSDGVGRITWSRAVKCTPTSWEIFRMRDDGSFQTRLTFTPDGTINEHPVWSDGPDVDGNRKIIFVRTDGSGNRHLWKMNWDGSAQVQLTFGTVHDNHPFERSGTIYFVREIAGVHQLRTIPLAGGVVGLVPGLADGGVNRWHPSVNGSNTVVAYVQGPPAGVGNTIVLHTMPLGPTVVDAGPAKLSAPNLNFDGTHILFGWDPDSDGQYDIYRKAVGAPLATAVKHTDIGAPGPDPDKTHNNTPYAQDVTSEEVFDWVRTDKRPSPPDLEIYKKAITPAASPRFDLTNDLRPDTKVVESGSCNPVPPPCPERPSPGVNTYLLSGLALIAMLTGFAILRRANSNSSR